MRNQQLSSQNEDKAVLLHETKILRKDHADMHQFAEDGECDIEAFRARLRRMSDAKLLEYGKAGAFLCRPEQWGKPRELFVIRLREMRAEWRRRHPIC
jgi:hypothetical protein